MQKDSIGVLLIEYQTLTRIGIRTILEGQKGFEIVGETDTGAKGFDMFQDLKPDVTILGLRLPDACAVDEIGNYLGADKGAKIIVLAEHAGDSEISLSLKKGAFGYICTDISESELVKAIRAVNAGRKYIPSEIANILSEHLGQEELTPAERRILGSIVKGQSNKEIAYNLEISANTVKTHVKNIFDKLNVSDRTSAATVAIKRGLVRIDV